MRFRQAFVPQYLLLGCVIVKGCTCDPPRQARRSTIIPCVPQHEMWAEQAEPFSDKSIMAGTMPASISVTESGGIGMGIALDEVPGRGAPDLTLSYDSSNTGAGTLGLGFSIAGVDAVRRYPKTMAIDGESRAGTTTAASYQNSFIDLAMSLLM